MIINKAKTIELSNERVELRPPAYSNDPAIIAEYDDQIAALTKALSNLPARMERVLRMYYGFNIEGITYQAIGVMHSRVNTERIRQIKCKGERFLRHQNGRVPLDIRLQKRKMRFPVVIKCRHGNLIRYAIR